MRLRLSITPSDLRRRRKWGSVDARSKVNKRHFFKKRSFRMSKNDRNYSSSGYRRIVNAVDVLWLLIHVGIEIYLYWGCANLKQKCHLHQN